MPSPRRVTLTTMENQPAEQNLTSPRPNLVKAIGLVTLGLAMGAAGIYVGETDDAPGAAVLGLLLMVTLVVFGVRSVRRKT